jgi:glucose uptake protein GlcU
MERGFLDIKFHVSVSVERPVLNERFAMTNSRLIVGRWFKILAIYRVFRKSQNGMDWAFQIMATGVILTTVAGNLVDAS